MAFIHKHPGNKCHKPGCMCRACISCRRKEETLALATRARELSVVPPTSEDENEIVVKGEIINADHPFKRKDPRAGHTNETRIGKKPYIRNIVASWLEYRTLEPGIKNIEVAKRLNISERSLCSYIKQCNKEGWLRFDDPISRIDHELIPKALDNLSGFLDAKDKTATLEMLKATMFKTYLDSKGISDAPQTVLALKIETVDPSIAGDQGKILTGHVVGKARELGE